MLFVGVFLKPQVVTGYHHIKHRLGGESGKHFAHDFAGVVVEVIECSSTESWKFTDPVTLEATFDGGSKDITGVDVGVIAATKGVSIEQERSLVDAVDDVSVGMCCFAPARLAKVV